MAFCAYLGLSYSINTSATVFAPLEIISFTRVSSIIFGDTFLNEHLLLSEYFFACRSHSILSQRYANVASGVLRSLNSSMRFVNISFCCKEEKVLFTATFPLSNFSASLIPSKGVLSPMLISYVSCTEIIVTTLNILMGKLNSEKIAMASCCAP